MLMQGITEFSFNTRCKNKSKMNKKLKPLKDQLLFSMEKKTMLQIQKVA